MFSQLTNTQKKADSQLQDLQKNILETSRTTKSSFQPFPETRTHGRNSFLYKSPNKQWGSPQQVQGSLDEILQDLENQVHHYTRLVPTIRKFLQLEMDKFRAGNVKKFLPNWQQITENSEILETVQGAKILFFTIPPSTVKNNPKFTQPETDAIDNEISKLLQKGVEKPYHEEGEFISIFVTPKSDGGYRLILNLKSLNEDIDTEHFEMHGLKEILKLVERNRYMAALDIKDAYY